MCATGLLKKFLTNLKIKFILNFIYKFFTILLKLNNIFTVNRILIFYDVRFVRGVRNLEKNQRFFKKSQFK